MDSHLKLSRALSYPAIVIVEESPFLMMRFTAAESSTASKSSTLNVLEVW